MRLRPVLVALLLAAIAVSVADARCQGKSCSDCTADKRCSWCGSEGCADEDDCSVKNDDSSRYQVIVGGIEISSQVAWHESSLNYGTLGCLGTITNRPGKLFGFTNGHVVKNSMEALADAREESSSNMGLLGSLWSNVAGTVTGSKKPLKINNPNAHEDPDRQIGTIDSIAIIPVADPAHVAKKLDGATIELQHVSWACEIADIGPVYYGTTPDDQLVGTRVRKRGRTTRLTTGRITKCDKHNCEIESEDGTLFSMGGDSGSVIVNDKNQIVGILYAGGHQCGAARFKGQTDRAPTMMIRASEGFKAMGFTPCGKHVGFVPELNLCNFDSKGMFQRASTYTARNFESCVAAVGAFVTSSACPPSLKHKCPRMIQALSGADAEVTHRVRAAYDYYTTFLGRSDVAEFAGHFCQCSGCPVSAGAPATCNEHFWLHGRTRLDSYDNDHKFSQPGSLRWHPFPVTSDNTYGLDRYPSFDSGNSNSAEDSSDSYSD